MKGKVASAVSLENGQVRLTISLENGQTHEETIPGEQARLWGVGTKVEYELVRERKPRGPRKPKADQGTQAATNAPASVQ